MNIVIKEILLQTLDRIATENELTSEQYASNIVNSFLESQYRASIVDKIKIEPIENLKILKEEELKNIVIKKIIKEK